MSEEQIVEPVPETPVKRFEMPAEDETILKPSEPEKELATEAKTEEKVITEPEKAAETQDQPAKQPVKTGKKGFERVIDKLYKSVAEQQARNDELARQLEELKPKPSRTDGLKLDDFEFDVDKYASAVAKDAEQKAIKRYIAEQEEITRNKQQQRLVSDWERKALKAEDKYADFDEIVGEMKPDNPVFVAIMQADNGDDIAYHLGKNMEEAKRIMSIMSLDPVSAIREIGRLEAKLLAEPVKEKVPSKAPAPITPVSGKTGVMSADPSDEDDDATWIRKRSKQVRG